MCLKIFTLYNEFIIILCVPNAYYIMQISNILQKYAFSMSSGKLYYNILKTMHFFKQRIIINLSNSKSVIAWLGMGKFIENKNPVSFQAVNQQNWQQYNAIFLDPPILNIVDMHCHILWPWPGESVWPRVLGRDLWTSDLVLMSRNSGGGMLWKRKLLSGEMSMSGRIFRTVLWSLSGNGDFGYDDSLFWFVHSHRLVAV